MDIITKDEIVVQESGKIKCRGVTFAFYEETQGRNPIEVRTIDDYMYCRDLDEMKLFLCSYLNGGK